MLAPPSATGRQVTLEIAAAFTFATGVAAVLYRVGLPPEWFGGILAGLLIFVPLYILWNHDLARYGVTVHPLRRNLLLVAAAVAAIFPLFLIGYLGWERIACALPALRSLAPLPCTQASMWSRFTPRLPAGALELAAGQLLVVAVPEEFFFRGFVQGRLAEVWPARGILGVPAGPILVAAALFALCHPIVQGNLATLAVFFPGLVFGWLRARTGSLLPCTLFHALCNLYIESLQRSFFG
ncbi:MAG: JDVT-CTERM system CAAX-type protease [Myxococcales bacterium]|nr:JDVT-CTERM system CAAX-type protease [Myxococcales bacterium]